MESWKLGYINYEMEFFLCDRVIIGKMLICKMKEKKKKEKS